MKFSKKTKIIIGVLICLLTILCIGCIYMISQINKFESSENDDYEIEMSGILSIPEYDELIPAEYKKCIHKYFIENGFLYGEKRGDFFLTTIRSRAKDVIAFGYFSSQDDNTKPDIAFLLEENDFKSSSLHIMSPSGCFLQYHKYFKDELPVINSFKKGEKIYMDEPELVSSPSDGIILKFKYNKKALIFNPKTKTFEEYYQYSHEDLEGIKREKEYYEEENSSQSEREETNQDIEDRVE